MYGSQCIQPEHQQKLFSIHTSTDQKHYSSQLPVLAFAMPPSAAKRQKLNQLQSFKARLPHHRQSALQAILEEVRDTGLPDLASSNHQREARQVLLADCHGGALGPLIQTAQVEASHGTQEPLAYTSLLVYLAALYAKSSSSTCTKGTHLAQASHGALCCTWTNWCQEMCLAELRGSPGHFMPHSSNLNTNWQAKMHG